MEPNFKTQFLLEEEQSIETPIYDEDDYWKFRRAGIALYNDTYSEMPIPPEEEVDPDSVDVDLSDSFTSTLEIVGDDM